MFNEMRDNTKNISIGDSGGRNFLNNVASWCSNLISDMGHLQSIFDGDVIGLNAKKIGFMMGAIEDYIIGINKHLDEIKANTSTENAMKGEYASAVKYYVITACDLCYKITSYLRYFQDQLAAVRTAYEEKAAMMSDTIVDAAYNLEQTGDEYQTRIV